MAADEEDDDDEDRLGIVGVNFSVSDCPSFSESDKTTTNSEFLRLIILNSDINESLNFSIGSLN